MNVQINFDHGAIDYVRQLLSALADYPTVMLLLVVFFLGAGALACVGLGLWAYIKHLSVLSASRRFE